MNSLDQLLAASQYSLGASEKERLLLEGLGELTRFHIANCPTYSAIIRATGGLASSSIDDLASIPLLPVGLFKRLELKSITENDVLKTLTSSGTTSQTVSKIFVDRLTASLQTKALASIITHFVGPKRLPMIIVDSVDQLRKRSSLSARGAGIVGLSNFGRNHFYALDEQMQLDIDGLKAFIERHAGDRILIFGFTFMVWRYLYGELKRRNEAIHVKDGILIHSGGWKKLQEEKVSNDVFKAELFERCKIARVHNFYGMVEQVGSIYMECEYGHFHAPNSANILIRDAHTLDVCPPGTTGLIQTLSVLPRSYPGHSLLTEDLGEILGVDNCPCGRLGTHFRVHGRVPRSELRGCSDTHAASLNLQPDKEVVSLLFPYRDVSFSLDELIPPSFWRLDPLPAFSPITFDFLTSLSKGLLGNRDARAHPELIALAFWLRRANLEAAVRSFQAGIMPNEIVAPRGLVFHVAPSNVDTIFVYSWALSLLCGNRNVLRVSSRLTAQMEVLLSTLLSLTESGQWLQVLERNYILTYPHSESLNRRLSEEADARMIWGGNSTVDAFRQIPVRTSTKDVVFPDKFSYSAIHSERYLKLSKEERREKTRLFFNDAYSFDQMACSSPRVVYFVGTEPNNERASQAFWSALAEECEHRTRQDETSVAIDKMNLALQIGAQSPDVKLTRVLRPGPTVLHVPADQITVNRLHCGGGFFYECFVNSIEDLRPFVKADDQTLTYCGFTGREIRAAAELLCLKGVSRIVPVGQALDFSPTWDGYVLLNELTRRISVK